MGQDHTMDPEDSDRPSSRSDVAGGVGSHRRMARVIHSRNGDTVRSGSTPWWSVSERKSFSDQAGRLTILNPWWQNW